MNSSHPMEHKLAIFRCMTNCLPLTITVNKIELNIIYHIVENKSYRKDTIKSCSEKSKLKLMAKERSQKNMKVCSLNLLHNK